MCRWLRVNLLLDTAVVWILVRNLLARNSQVHSQVLEPAQEGIICLVCRLTDLTLSIPWNLLCDFSTCFAGVALISRNAPVFIDCKRGDFRITSNLFWGEPKTLLSETTQKPTFIYLAWNSNIYRNALYYNINFFTIKTLGLQHVSILFCGSSSGIVHQCLYKT